MMRRRLLNLLTSLSLLLCVAACVLWARSYWAADFGGWETLRGGSDPCWLRHGVWSGAGGIGWGSADDRLPHGTHPSDLGLPEMYGRFHWRVMNDAGPTYPFAHFPLQSAWEGAGFFRVRVSANFPNSPAGGHLRSRQLSGTSAPAWAAVLAFGLFPSARWTLRGGRLWMGIRRTVRGQCRRCGYDLRATPDQCPECGQTAMTRRSAR
jgi:hypothetical protein